MALAAVYLVSLAFGMIHSISDQPCISAHLRQNGSIGAYSCSKFKVPDMFYQKIDAATNFSTILHANGSVLGIDKSSSSFTAIADSKFNLSNFLLIKVEPSNSSKIPDAVRIVMMDVNSSDSQHLIPRCLTIRTVVSQVLNNKNPSNVTVSVPDDGFPMYWGACNSSSTQDFLMLNTTQPAPPLNFTVIIGGSTGLSTSTTLGTTSTGSTSKLLGVLTPTGSSVSSTGSFAPTVTTSSGSSSNSSSTTGSSSNSTSTSSSSSTTGGSSSSTTGGSSSSTTGSSSSTTSSLSESPHPVSLTNTPPTPDRSITQITPSTTVVIPG